MGGRAPSLTNRRKNFSTVGEVLGSVRAKENCKNSTTLQAVAIEKVKDPNVTVLGYGEGTLLAAKKRTSKTKEKERSRRKFSVQEQRGNHGKKNWPKRTFIFECLIDGTLSQRDPILIAKDKNFLSEIPL